MFFFRSVARFYFYRSIYVDPVSRTGCNHPTLHIVIMPETTCDSSHHHNKFDFVFILNAGSGEPLALI